MRGRTFAVAGSVLTLALGVTACGSDDDDEGGGSGSGGGTVNIYSSLPLQGASKDQTAAMVNGMKLAVKEAGNKAGDLNVKYESLDDSTASAGTWDPQQTAANARKVAQDENAVFYIGEFNSGASAISIPILNQAGVPQLSPANTYPGLTTSEPGTEEGEPDKYYPTGNRTYARIVPRDKIQSAALLAQMKQDGCTAIGIANDKETYGAGLARIMVQQAEDQNINVTSNTGIDKAAANYRSFASTLEGEDVDCFVFSGVTANGSVQIYKDVAAALPQAKLYGPDGVCESGFTNPAKKGLPKALASRFKCSVATLDLNAIPGGREFVRSYSDEYGEANPDPYAIYGYEAMKLGLDTIAGLGENGDDKAEVLKALFATRNRESVLGTYSIDKNGDTSLTDYGIYTIGPDGDPEFDRAVEAQV